MPKLDFLEKFSKEAENIVYVSTYKSPVGEVVAAGDNEYLYIVTFEDSKGFEKGFKTLAEKLSCNFKQERKGVLKKFEEEFEDYLEGNLKKFTIPFKTFGTDFQKEVWERLLDIPYGSTQSYSDLAKAMGRPVSHSRAVGAACGANAHLLVVPCHRLVASASKGGFNSGVDRKEWLLKHEKKYL